MVAKCSRPGAARLQIPLDDNLGVMRGNEAVGTAENLHGFTLQQSGKGKLIQRGRERERRGKGKLPVNQPRAITTGIGCSCITHEAACMAAPLLLLQLIASLSGAMTAARYMPQFRPLPSGSVLITSGRVRNLPSCSG